VSDGRGFLYRFPDRDFQLGMATRVPEVGETLSAKGRMWTVARVTRGFDKRAVIHLEAADKPTGGEAETPFSPE
jgi:hypothetical protein